MALALGVPNSLFVHCAGLTIEQTVGGEVMTYTANSAISITSISESTPTSGGGLVCRTDRDDCCILGPGRKREGDWIYPDGVTPVQNSGDIYRTRGVSTVILNRRNDATRPTGLYCCKVASVDDLNAMICINLSK